MVSRSRKVRETEELCQCGGEEVDTAAKCKEGAWPASRDGIRDESADRAACYPSRLPL